MTTREPGDLPFAVDSFARTGCAGRTRPKSSRERHEPGRGPDVERGAGAAPVQGACPLSDLSRFALALRLSAVLGAFVVALPAQAQDAPQDDQVTLSDVKHDDIVVTSSGVPQSAETVGQAVTVIDRATIEQRQTVALSDLLATTPGVTVSRNGGIGGLTAVRIRGAEAEQTLTLIDGVRVNDPSSPGGGFDFANLLAGSIDRVEVLRGPNSVPWGGQAIGGVVNVITMRPTEGLQARGNIEYGDYNSVFANAGISGSSGIVSGALTGGYLHTDGVSAAASGTEPDGYRQYGATGRVEIAFAPNIRLDLRGYYAGSRTELDSYLAIDDREYSKAQELYGYAGLHADFLNGRFRNTLAFTIADINRDNYDRDATPTLLYFYRGRSERYSYQGDLQASDAIRLVAGVEHEDTRYFDGFDRFSRGVTSVYGEVLLTPIDRLSLTGGVRYDDDDAYGGHTTWGANAVYILPTNTRLRASYAEGFKAPTLYQLYNAWVGNRDLKPETARSYDIGIEQPLIGNRLTASATWFHRVARNEINGYAPSYAYFNVDRARSQGVEFALTMRPVEGFTVEGSYSFIDSKNLSPGTYKGNDLARRPRQTASLSADYRFGFGLSVGGTVTIVGDSFDNAANTVRLDGYTLTGLRAELPVGHGVSIYGRVDNLFDEKYQTAANYGMLGRAAYGGIRVKLD